MRLSARRARQIRRGVLMARSEKRWSLYLRNLDNITNLTDKAFFERYYRDTRRY